MKLAVVNGSPRGRKSNSDRIINWMIEDTNNIQKVYVADLKKQDESIKLISNSDIFLFVFPLYTDSMSGLSKAFFEKMSKLNLEGKSIAFVVHSGFSEAIHSRMAEKYCAYFAKINKMKFLGCVVMGGSEAMQVAPDGYFGKKIGLFKALGQSIKENQVLDKDILKKLAGAECFSKFTIFMLRFMPTDMYWNSQLRKNGVYEKRFNKPYSSN